MGLFSAVVTGGASGIGTAVARKLASRGIAVLIADVQVEKGQSLVKEIRTKYKTPAEFVRTDVSQESDVQKMVQTAVDSWGRLDYAANCAGICEKIFDEEETVTAELVDRTYRINQRGLWLCQKYEALQMKSQTPREVEYLPASAAPPTPQRGSIANVASICGVTALGLAAYTPTKHAAIGITRNGAKFYGPLGVRVNAVCPGFTLTEMLQDVLGNEYTPGSKASEEHGLVPHVALRRFGLPEEQANVVSFLLSPESSFINGTHIINDGGFESVR